MNYLIGKNGNYFEVGTSGSMHVFSSDDDYSIGFEEYPKFFLPMAALYLAHLYWMPASASYEKRYYVKDFYISCFSEWFSSKFWGGISVGLKRLFTDNLFLNMYFFIS